MSAVRKARIIVEARTLRRSDPNQWNWAALARHFNVRTHWLRRQIDDDYSDRYDAVHDSRDGERGRRPMTLEQLKRHRANIKHDTRSLTGRLMGDPQPDRSALAMKQRGAAQ